MSNTNPPTPQNMSPAFGFRTVNLGSSVPSSRVSGIHEDHHRSNSGVDLASLVDLRDNIRRRGSMNSDTTDGMLNDLNNKVGEKSNGDDDYDVDAAKGEEVRTSKSGEEKRLRPTVFSDSSDEDDAKRSPSELSLVSSPYSLLQEGQASRKEGRLLIVANRLPLSMKVTKKLESNGKEVNDITFSSSSGGLVSALSGCQMESRWIGWPGAEVKRSRDREIVRKKLDEQNCVPVFLPQKVCDDFYNGFCNNVLWPLFHYLPLPVESITSADGQFEAYKIANQAFADVVIQTYQEGDIVWLHDYHCMLLPQILRQRFPKIKIGFFFHTPFPAFEIYRVMPARRELLAGVLSADLIGFHTPDYQRHFQDSCLRILPGARAEGDTVTFEGFTSKLGAYAIGIDPKRFLQTIETEQINQYMEQYRKDFHGKKVFLGIDRLDYIKGIQHKMFALERMFEKHPEVASEVVLVQIAVPSRTDVVEYQRLKAATHKLVGRINGQYGSVGSSPIHYLDQSIEFTRMCALYRVADAMVITSVRDGMNLVAYEYIACQKDMAGTLILSEFAGAAQSLQGGALSVNPWSVTEVADAMYNSLVMTKAERKQRNEIMFKHVTTQTSGAWARQFLTAVLQATKTPLNWLKDLGGAESSESEVMNDEFETGTRKSAAAIQPVVGKQLPTPPAPREGTTRSIAAE